MVSYRIMATAIDALGHINACLGFSEGLKAAGHEVVFVQKERFRPLAERRGFSFIPLDEFLPGVDIESAIFQWIDLHADKFRSSPTQRCEEMTLEAQEQSAAQAQFFIVLNDALDKVVTENKFDLIVLDIPAPMPFLYKHSSIPWVPLASLNPIILYPEAPPPFSGFSVNSDKSAWKPFSDVYQQAHSMLTKAHNDRLAELGLEARFNPAIFVDQPKYFGFYHYPEALDYDECEPRRENWFRVDAWIRKADIESDFELPENLRDRPGKLVYFSMGSLGSADLVLMRKLLAILAKSPNKFIISKGPRGDQLELADNMWGENYVNQIKVLQSVDLVITHGGNNTFMETLYYGKPMIVIPYFYDQFDNAQRVVDKQIGFRVNPYELDEEHLLECIERTMHDEEMSAKVKRISINMRHSNSLNEAVRKIETLIESSQVNSTQL